MKVESNLLYNFQLSTISALPLLMFGSFANYPDTAATPDYFAIFANFFYTASYFHIIVCKLFDPWLNRRGLFAL